MNIAGSLNYDTKIDTKGLEEGINKSTGKAKELGGVMTVALGNLMSNLASMAIDGLTEIAKAGVRYNAEIEKYQTALTTLTGNANKANKIINQIKKDAAKTPFDVNGLVKANQLLISAGVESDKAREDILNLGNAIAATGGGNVELERMATNLQQIKNVGKASSLDIKQFAYAGIDVYGLLADSMGVTRAEASKMKVTYNDLTKALAVAAQEGGRYAGAMEAQSKTFNGQVSNLKDNLQQFMGNAAKPLFDFLSKDILPIVNKLIQGEGDIGKNIQDLSSKISEFISISLQKLMDMLPQVLDIGIQIILSLISGIVEQAPTLISKMGDLVIKMVQKLNDNFPKIVEAGADIITNLISGLNNNTYKFLDKAPQLIVDFVDGLTNDKSTDKLETAGGKIIKSVVQGFTKNIIAFTQLPSKLGRLFQERFETSIKGIDWGEFGKWIVEGVWNGITKKREKFFKDVKKFFKDLVAGAKEALGIGSPSKLFRDEVGQWIPKGVAVGIEANTDSVDKAIEELNDEMLDKMTQAVNVETGKMTYSGTNGTITQMLSAFGTTTVVNDNKLYLDGDEIYQNQQTVSAKKNLQTQFGGGYSVSS